MAIVASQSRDVKWVQQIAERRISSSAEQSRRVADHLLVLTIARTCDAVAVNQNFRGCQDCSNVGGNRCWNRLFWPQAAQHGFVLGPQPKWQQGPTRTGGNPGDCSL